MLDDIPARILPLRLSSLVTMLRSTCTDTSRVFHFAKAAYSAFALLLELENQGIEGRREGADSSADKGRKRISSGFGFDMLVHYITYSHQNKLIVLINLILKNSQLGEQQQVPLAAAHSSTASRPKAPLRLARHRNPCRRHLYAQLWPQPRQQRGHGRWLGLSGLPEALGPGMDEWVDDAPRNSWFLLENGRCRKSSSFKRGLLRHEKYVNQVTSKIPTVPAVMLFLVRDKVERAHSLQENLPGRETPACFGIPSGIPLQPWVDPSSMPSLACGRSRGHSPSSSEEV